MNPNELRWMRGRVVVAAMVTALACALAACGNDDGGGENDATADTVSADGAGADADAGDSAANASDGDGGDAGAADPSRLRVLNYNVMCSFCKNKAHPDYVHDWSTRVPWLKDVLSRHDADLVGVQELQAFGIPEGGPDEFDQILPPGYETFYYRNQPGDTLDIDYPDAAIAWRKSRFVGLEDGAFWLSPTPDKAFSTGFASGGQLPRLVVWVRLRDTPNDRELIVVNTHFDNNAPSQKLSAPLLLERLLPLAQKAPLVVVGDFNSRPNSDAYALLIGGEPELVDSYNEATATLAATPESVVVSNATPPPVWDVTDRIDHIFFHGPFEVLAWIVDLYRYGDKQQPPSDHPGAVVVDLRWQPK
jgi:endonuclease/exonuclease/phosphatase family metal-dependent hydrolase